MKRTIFTITLALMFSVFLVPVAQASQENSIAGKFFLQVESNGELWYILPDSGERYYIQGPSTAKSLIEFTAVGISNKNLELIQEAGEEGGHYDYHLTKRLSGKFLLQVEGDGEAWYLNPMDKKRYYLGRPHEAFNLFSSIAQGIDNKTIQNIAVAESIVDVAMRAGNFETLLQALEAAGLEDALDKNGPYTVFAPRDEAFAKIPQSDIEGLLADPVALANVLLNHVVPGSLDSEQVLKRENLQTLQGSSLRVDSGNGVRIGEAGIVATDIKAVNGVIHVIDTVLMP